MPEGEAILNTRTGERVALLGVSANGRVSGMTFECAVEQRYRNDTGRNVEVVYTFPLPDAAVLLSVELCIGDRRLAGIVMPKARAERTYEDAIEKGDLPVMIERSAHGLFTANVGNLRSGEEAVIRYRWAQLLRFEHAGIRVAIPTTIAPRYGDPVKDGGLGLHASADASLSAAYPFSLSIEISGELAAGRVRSPTHAIDLRRTETGLVVGLARDGFLDRDFVLRIDDLRLPAAPVERELHLLAERHPAHVLDEDQRSADAGGAGHLPGQGAHDAASLAERRSSSAVAAVARAGSSSGAPSRRATRARRSGPRSSSESAAPDLSRAVTRSATPQASDARRKVFSGEERASCGW
jgi:hypothetical protein